jgi:hypothetical protein
LPGKRRRIELTATKYELLRVLSQNAGSVLSYDRLLRSVWGRRGSRVRGQVRTYVKKLRHKLGDDAAKPRLHPHRARRRLPHARAGQRRCGRVPRALSADIFVRNLHAAQRFAGVNDVRQDSASSAAILRMERLARVR